MKAIGFSATFIVFVMLLGCGSSQNGPRIGGPVGPFLITLSQSSSTILSFKGNDSGAISPIGSAQTGSSPSALVVELPETFQPHVFVTDSGTNTLTVFNLDSNTGMVTPAGISAATGTNPVAIALLENFSSQAAPPTIYVLNQGSNSISAFQMNGQMQLTAVKGSPFSTQANPQAFTTASIASAEFVYVANGTQGTISGFQINNDGSLTEVSGSPFAVGHNISWVTAQQLHLGAQSFGGSFVYASEAASNTILGFKVQSNGTLVPVSGSPFQGVAQPGIIQTNDTFLYVVNVAVNTISGFQIDSNTGALTAVPGPQPATGSNPSAIAIIARGPTVYVANRGSNNISGFSADVHTGALTPVPGSPFAVSPSPVGLGQLFIMNVD
jgi:6-phosphogluconolactonase (cycloisomerase 2 family)